MRKFSQNWINIDVNKATGRSIAKLLPTTSKNLITAYQMTRNSYILTLAFESLELKFINLRLSQGKDSVAFVNKNVKSVSLAHPDVEPDHKIRSLGLVPYSDLIIAAPQRFGLYKVDRIAGKITTQVRPSLDQVRFIVMPEPSSSPSRDPYNPGYIRGKKVSKRMHDLLSNCSTFLMTSHSNELIAFYDWTTLKAYGHYPWQRFNSRSQKPEYLVVDSACFFGGVPEAHLYVLSPSFGTRHLLALSGVYRDYAGYVELSANPKRVELTWLYGTNYIMCVMFGIEDLSSDVYQLAIVYMGPLQGSARTTMSIGTGQGISSLRGFKDFRHANVITYSLSEEESQAKFLDTFEKMDHVYLLTYIEDIILKIEPPFFNWETCKQKMSPSSSNHIMLYGRYRNCYRSQCEVGFEPWASNPGQVNYFNCRKVLQKCSEKNQIEAIDVSYDKQRDTEVVQSKCMDPYTLKTTEVGTANDNQCQPGFNLDQYGFCRKCYISQKMFNDMARYNSRVSDCLLFNSFTIFDSYSFSYYRYTFKDYNKLTFFKGVTELEYFSRDLFDPTKMKSSDQTVDDDDDSGDGGSGVGQDVSERDFYHNEHIFVMRDTKTSDYKRCYNLVPNSLNSSTYTLRTINGYFLDEITNDPTGQASKQVKLYAESGDLNKFFCSKYCPFGQYYEFDSISCRRCSFKCAKCSKYEKCERCSPGFQLIKQPEHPLHKKKEVFNPLLVDTCQLGCQSGFHLRAFNGECRECLPSCISCKDSVFWGRNNGTRLSDPTFCLKCNQTDNQGRKLFLSTATGQCITECSGFGRREEIANVSGKVDVRFCVECASERCSECTLLNNQYCTKCVNPFILNDGRCVAFTETEAYTRLLVAIISIVIVATGIFLMVFFYQVVRLKDSRASMRKLKKKLRKKRLVDLTDKDVEMVLKKCEIEMDSMDERCLDDFKRNQNLLKDVIEPVVSDAIWLISTIFG